MPPVARMTATRGWRINSCVPAIVTESMAPIAFAGAPAPRAARSSRRTVRLMQSTAAGCGLITIGQRAFIAMSSL